MNNLWAVNRPQDLWLCEPDFPNEIWQEAMLCALPLLDIEQLYGGHLGAGGSSSIAGTPQQCLEKIGEHVRLGCTMFVIEFFGRDTREPAQIFAESVMAKARAF